MERYNKPKELILPEYGRNVQQMVDHCISIEDREERQNCARSIVRTMSSVSPSHSKNDNENIYWDHLAMMSNFLLDIDYPKGTITKEEINTKANKAEYQNNRIRYRYYGNIIESMIAKIVDMPDGPERQKLEYLIALQMKKSYITWNKDNVEDIKIFKDLYELSNGRIVLTPENCELQISNSNSDKSNKGRSKKNKKK